MAQRGSNRIIRTAVLVLGGTLFLFWVIFGIRGWYRYEQNKDLLAVIAAVQSREYSPDYQCLDFSRDLSRRLTKVGIPNSIAIVDDGSPSSYHAVVSILIEPQDGKIVDYPVVDLCRPGEGPLVCQNGALLGRNGYVAGRKE